MKIPNAVYDVNGYPSDQALRFIKKYDVMKEPVMDLVHFVVQMWHFDEWGVKLKGRKLQLHTGGWSGNESIIDAMSDNYMFWSMCWMKSERGGHFWFEIPTFLIKRKGVPPAEQIGKEGHNADL